MDQHDVDEDLTAIAEQSGQWGDEIQTGIALRNIASRPTASGESVASVCRHSRIIFMITRIIIMSTKI